MDGTEEFIYRATMEKQAQRIIMDMGRGEERVRCMERVTWKLTLPEKKKKRKFKIKGLILKEWARAQSDLKGQWKHSTESWFSSYQFCSAFLSMSEIILPLFKTKCKNTLRYTGSALILATINGYWN